MNNFLKWLTFIAVVEEQSFTKAAAKLGITPTAVSKQIKELEAQFNQQLLTRNTRKVAITEIGERFYSYCKRIQEEAQMAERFIEAQHNEPQGKLRILSSIMCGQAYIIEHLQAFHARYPRIQIELEISDRIPDMEREGIDLLVGFSQFVNISGELRQRKLLDTHYLLCAAPGYLQKCGAIATPEDLKKHKLINHPLRAPLNVITFRNGAQIRMDMPEIVVNNIDALIKLCCDGAGILMVSEMQVRDYLAKKKLLVLLPDYPLQKVSCYLFYRHTKYEQRKVRCFIDFLLEKIK